MNNYEKPEAVELGKARNQILSQKEWDMQPVDNLGIPSRTDADTLDDFDE